MRMRLFRCGRVAMNDNRCDNTQAVQVIDGNTVEPVG